MKTLLGIALILFAVSVAAAADQDQDKHSASAENDASSRRQAILAEIKTLGDHEWAGEYNAGDGLGVNTSFVIAPRAGYVFEWHGCLGLYDRNYGAAQWTDGRIRLSFTFKNLREGFQGIAPEFVLVPWGSRHYLIPGDDIIGFCNNVNEGEEPRRESHGTYLLRRGDENKSVTGVPQVPTEYAQYLLPHPVEAAIIAVGPPTTRPSISDWKFKDTSVTIDAGKEQGMRIGMTLFVRKPQDTVESVQVTKVERTRSEAVMVQIGEKEPGPKTGWRLSTQAPWKAR